MKQEIRDLDKMDRELFERWKGEPPHGFKPFQGLRDTIRAEAGATEADLHHFDSLNGLMLLAYQGLFQKHAITPKGIIHVGAHTGSELRLYLTLGFTRVLLIEPNPVVLEPLRWRVALYNRVVSKLATLVDAPMATANRWTEPWCVVLPYAAGARDEEAQLHCTKESTMASLLDVSTDAKEAHVVERIPVRVRPIDSMMNDLPATWRPEDFNALWANVQGTELDVLTGARRTLEHTDLLAVELSYESRYRNEVSPKAVDAHLRANSFVPTFGLGVPQGGMRFYARSKNSGERYQVKEGDIT